MEFDFNLDELFEIDKNGFASLNGKGLQKAYNTFYQGSRSPQLAKISKLLDKIGEASSKAQGLGTVITNFSRLAFSSHRIYLKIMENKVIGFIKVGEKSLCYRQVTGKFIELSPVCVLDFYVNERFQRHGFGKEIFEFMLAKENVLPEKLAIDRPSFKFLSFLKKHFGLAKFSPQSNNFVIFDQFFEQANNSHKLEQVAKKQETKSPNQNYSFETKAQNFPNVK